MSLKVATRLWLGFWTPLGALALIGVLVGWYVVLVDDAFDEIARVEEPTGAAADETEINVIGSSMAVLRYVETGDPQYRRRVENGRTTLDRFKRQYHRLAQTAREQELGRRLALIDDEIQGVTHQGLEAAKETAHRRVRTIGWVLVALITGGTAVGLTTAVGVSRAIVGPIRALVNGAERFGSGDLDHRIELPHAFFRDVTERKAAEAVQARLRGEIEAAAEEWQRTFDAMKVPILVCDTRGRVRRANRMTLEETGRGLQDVWQQPLTSLGPGEPWRTARELVHDVGRTRSDASRRVTATAPERHWDIAVTLSPGAGEREGRFVVVARDITRLVELQEAARRAETMAALGALVGGVAHEVRNPLFGITATLDALEARAGEGGPHDEYFSVLRGEVERLNHLMRELLEYGKPFSRELAPGSVYEVIRESVGACVPLAERSGVATVLNAVSDLPRVWVDCGRLRQVFQNVLENAIQHSPRGGTVRVSATTWSEGNRRGVECTIADAGPGFAEGDLARVFQPFFTRRAGGTGLGLAIAHRIVDEHQGSIAVRNGAEGGAVVVVRLPGTGEGRPSGGGAGDGNG